MAQNLTQMAREHEQRMRDFPKEKFRNESGLEPVGHAVLVKPYFVEQTLKTDKIVLPDSVKGNATMLEQRAVVIAVSENAWHDEPTKRAKPGDHVLVTRFAGFMVGKDMTLDGHEYRLVNDRDIFCKLKEI